jgi:hypothetical protein
MPRIALRRPVTSLYVDDIITQNRNIYIYIYIYISGHHKITFHVRLASVSSDCHEPLRAPLARNRCDVNAATGSYRNNQRFHLTDLLPFCPLRRTILRKVVRLPHLEVTCSETDEAGLGP